LVRILGLVVTIALGDSLNPSTIGPALYIASGERARVAVLEFTLAVFVVHLAGGAILVLGPGELLVSLLNKLDSSARDLLELAAGLALLIAGIVLWAQRRRLGQKDLPSPDPQRKSAILLGATIIAAELPTAFPYFAAIAAIVGSGNDTAAQLALLCIYNLCFILPLVAILLALVLAGRHADDLLTRARIITQRRWPVVFAVLLSVLGFAVAGLAGAALVGD
jgi:cytochrome c biogenesis protein CcdA